MEQKKKKSGIIGMILGLLAGGVIGFGIVWYTEHSMPEGLTFGQEITRLLITLLMLYACIFLQIIIHEAGHLVFGLASGYQFVSFRVGSMQLTRVNGKLKLGRHGIAGTAGQCLMSPPDLVDGKMPVMLYNLGGALVNLITAMLCLTLFFILDPHNLMSTFCLCMAVFGLIFALSNGIPMRMGGVDNDGRNALSLVENKDAMAALWLQLKVNAELANGKRLKELPDEWFAVPSDEVMGNSLVAAVGVFACNRLLDQNRYTEAARLAEHLLEIDSGMLGVHRHMLTCDLLCCEMIGKNRREIIDRLYTQELKAFMKSMKTSVSVIRTQYIYALLVSLDTKDAASQLKRFESAKKTYPYPRDVLSDCELIAQAQKIAERENVSDG